MPLIMTYSAADVCPSPKRVGDGNSITRDISHGTIGMSLVNHQEKRSNEHAPRLKGFFRYLPYSRNRSRLSHPS